MAMDKELDLLLPMIENISTVTINDVIFYCGTLKDKELVVLKSGIGKVNAAVATLTLIENFHVNFLINSGVAGGTGRVGILDVVIAESAVYHDVWCGPGTIWGQVPGFPRFFQFPYAQAVIRALKNEEGFKAESFPSKTAQDENDSMGGRVRGGLIASGDIFVSDQKVLDRIKELYPDVEAVDMESAAIAQVCYLKNVPFLAVRVISDTPGAEDNIAQYESFWEAAPKTTFGVLNRILEII